MEEQLRILKEEVLNELSGNILPFWMQKMLDAENGGFYGHADFFGNPTIDANKGGILNARILWTFSSAYRILRKSEYLDTASRSYDYIARHFVDKDFGGSYWELDCKGNPVNSKKQIYALAFTMYGLTEFYRASGLKEALILSIDLFNTIEQYSFDAIQNGYFEAFTREWQPIEDLRLSAKDQNENKTMNTHLHILEAYTNLFRVWKDPFLEQQLKNLIELFIVRFVNSNGNLNLFFDDDWTLKSDFISFGHDIESSWLIQEAAELLGELEHINRSKQLSVRIALENMKGIGPDGGLAYEFFPSSGEWDRDRHWWPQAEAIVGYFNAFQVSGDNHFLETAFRSWEFIKKFLIDKENGEWHWSVNERGIPQGNEQKAGFWKCPYHNSRACLEIIERTSGK
ncbi:AGE family epimerase/isomerase [Bacteroidota bacterium]